MPNDTSEQIKQKSKNLKTRMADARKEDLRERINGSRLISQIYDLKDKVADDPSIDNETLSRYKFVVDTNLKLLAKCLPDLKAVEMSGADGSDLVIQLVRFGDKDK